MNRPDVLSMRQARNIVTHLKGEERLRDAAAVACGCGFGLRAGDVVGLRWGDVLGEGGKVRPRITLTEQKTGKLRTIHVLPFVADAVEAWRRIAPEQGTQDRLFPIGREHFWRIVRDTARDMGMRGTVTPHSLRKAFCDAVYAETRDPVLTARITGHSNPAQLMHYIGRSSEAEDAVWKRLASTVKGGR